MSREDIELFIDNLLEEEKLIEKYLLKYAWISGSSTTVYPIMVYRDEIVFQLDNTRNVFDKLIDRVLKKYDFIKYMSYWKSDGSCPNTLTIWFKEGVMK